jgi:hypothetical protein
MLQPVWALAIGLRMGTLKLMSRRCQLQAYPVGRARDWLFQLAKNLAEAAERWEMNLSALAMARG